MKEVKKTNILENNELIKEIEELDQFGLFTPMTYDKVFKAIFKDNLDLLKILVIDELLLNRGKYIKYKLELLDTEIPVKNISEYQKTTDIYVRIGACYVNIEINRSSFKNLEIRNIMYADRLYSTLIEKGTKTKRFKDYKFYQLNINTVFDTYLINGNEVVVLYDLVNERIVNENKIILTYYIEYYRNLYYNENRNLTRRELWLVLMSSLSYQEVYEIIIKLELPSDLGYRLMRKVINIMSKRKYFEEWELEKLNELVDYTEKETIRNDALKEGRQEMALSLMKEEVDIDIISRTTGISKSDLLLLKNESN